MTLSKQQAACMKLLCGGQGHKEIGLSLKISCRTVATHLERVRHKLACRSMYEAVALFVSMRAAPRAVTVRKKTDRKKRT